MDINNNICCFIYNFIVENTIEVNIYDKHKNRDIIIYEDYNKVKQELSAKEDILYIFKDYESLELNNSEIGNFNITPLLNAEMPTLIKGTYPKKENEILLPNLNFINGKKAYLTSYLGKNITLTLNNEKTLTFTVTGIYDSQNIHSIIYNLENINYLCEKLPSYI